MATHGRLVLRGWKGFEAEVPLWPVTFLVGPNGSGKSSLLESLALVSHLARRGNLREDLRSWLRGWPEGIFSKHGTKPPAQEARLEIGWGRSHYRLVVETPARPEIAEESLVVGKHEYIRTVTRGGRRLRQFLGEGAGRPLETSNPYESALGLIARSPTRRRRAQKMIDIMTRIEIYALDADFLRGTAVDPRPIPYARKGTGLVSGLIDAQRDPDVWRGVLAALRAVQPDLKTIETEVRPRGVILRYVDGRETQLDEESDGLVRAAGMFLVRYRRDCPAILGFDEPENGYHLSRLVEVMSRLAPDESELPGPEILVLATHSKELVYRAARILGPRMGVLALWRGKEGGILVREWPGTDLRNQTNFELLVAEGFEGR